MTFILNFEMLKSIVSSPLFVFHSINTMKYAYTVHPRSGMKLYDIAAVTTNIAMLAVIYAFLGSLTSFILYYLFDEYEPDKKEGLEWEKKSFAYHVADLIFEIVIIALSSFWIVFVVNQSFPIIPVHRHFVHFVDTYSTGLFFMYAVFMFVGSFGSKMRYMYQAYLAPTFDVWLPQEGSILDFSLRFRSQNGSGPQPSKE